MKKIIATALVAVATTAGAASAMTNAGALQSELNRFVPGVDVSTLTTAQVNSLLSIIHGGDSAGEMRAAVRSVLR